MQYVLKTHHSQAAKESTGSKVNHSACHTKTVGSFSPVALDERMLPFFKGADQISRLSAALLHRFVTKHSQ
jgi:hypothetical protein